MEPDNAGVGLRVQEAANAWGHAAEALGEALAVLARGGHLPEPPGRAEDEGEHQAEIVEEQNHADRPLQPAPEACWREPL